MLQNLIEQAARLEPHLIEGDYIFIAPIDQQPLERFIRRANDIAPVVAFSRSIHHALSHKGATLRALQELPPNTPLRIYVVTPVPDDGFLMHSTLEDYCNNHNINLQA